MGDTIALPYWFYVGYSAVVPVICIVIVTHLSMAYVRRGVTIAAQTEYIKEYQHKLEVKQEEVFELSRRLKGK